MREIRVLRKAIWEGYELKAEISGEVKDVDEVAKAEVRVTRRWKFKYPREHRCFFKWTKRCPEFCDFEKPCEQLVTDDGEDEEVSYCFLVLVEGVYYFSHDFEIDEENRFLIFHTSVEVGKESSFYRVEREENKFGFVEIAIEIVASERVFCKKPA